MNLSEEIRSLEAQGVFIHVGHEHYKDGSNCNWSIEFTQLKQSNNQTGWFGDNHEFGDTVDCYLAAFRLAKFLLQDDNLKWYFLSVYETVTDQGRADWLKSRDVQEKAHDVTYPSTK